MWRGRTVRELLRQAEQREREYQRQIKDLHDKLLYLLDKPWNVPPAALPLESEPELTYDFELADQLPLE